MVRREFLKVAAALTGFVTGGRAASAESAILPTGQKALDLDSLDKAGVFGDKRELLLSGSEAVPAVWQGYLSSSHDMRMRHLEVELGQLATILPRTAGALRDVVKDVFVISFNDAKYGRRFARILNCIDTFDSPADSELFSNFSLSIVPDVLANEQNGLFVVRAPEGLSRLYTTMFDGLESVWGGGLRPMETMGTLASLKDVYEEQPWYDDFLASRRPELVYEIVQNMGGINILLDLNHAEKARSSTPTAIWVDVKDRTFEEKDFRDFTDTLMSIIMSGR